jgi:hypothetical protein
MRLERVIKLVQPSAVLNLALILIIIATAMELALNCPAQG